MSGYDERVVHAQRWLRFANEDLHVAELLLKDQPPRVICFHAHQAAEKAIKALLVLVDAPFPRTHDLDLLQLLLPEDWFTKGATDLPELSAWSVQARYPTDAAEPSRGEAARALALATNVVNRAHQDLNAQPSRRSSMSNITAQMVNELRAKTGQGMMECKKVLQEVGGDLDAAIKKFREKGVKASLQERAATEGRVVGVLAEDRRSVALVEINCNTDFTAKSTPFLELGAKAARALLHNPGIDIAQAAEVNANATEVAQTTGENIRVGKTAHLAAPSGGTCGLYLYNITGKIGVIMSFAGAPSDELITDVGGHIAFTRPLALNRAGIAADLVERERGIAVEQAKATGKPQQIAEKIAEGKLNAFFKEQSLLDQDFFNAGKFKGSISQMLQQQSVKLENYARIEVGQG